MGRFGGILAVAAAALTFVVPAQGQIPVAPVVPASPGAKIKIGPVRAGGTPVKPASRAVVRRSPAWCASRLSCGIAEIDLMTITERIELMEAMMRGPGARFGAQSRWRNIQGVMMFFRDHGWGAPDTWTSYVDAGIVEGVERGLALALGRKGGDFGNPGSVLWQKYVTGLRAGYPSRAAHDRAWGEAEQASTDYGYRVAVKLHNRPPSRVEQGFFDFSELYRSILRNKQEAASVVAYYGVLSGRPEVVYRSRDFVDWFTNVGNYVPAYMGSEMSFRFASLDIFGGIAQGINIFFTSLPDILNDYLADRQQGARAAGRRRLEPLPRVEASPRVLRRLAPHLAR